MAAIRDCDANDFFENIQVSEIIFLNRVELFSQQTLPVVDLESLAFVGYSNVICSFLFESSSGGSSYVGLSMVRFCDQYNDYQGTVQELGFIQHGRLRLSPLQPLFASAEGKLLSPAL